MKLSTHGRSNWPSYLTRQPPHHSVITIVALVPILVPRTETPLTFRYTKLIPLPIKCVLVSFAPVVTPPCQKPSPVKCSTCQKRWKLWDSERWNLFLSPCKEHWGRCWPLRSYIVQSFVLLWRSPFILAYR